MKVAPIAALPLPAVRRAVRGFTLVEMLTAVTVLAVLLAVAGPGIAGFVRSSRVNAAQSELVSSMMLARSEAAKRGREVQLLAAGGANAADFAGGWLVGWDANDDGTIDASDGSAEVIRRYPAPAGGIVVRPPAGAASAAVRFAATGFLSPPSARVFEVCGSASPANCYCLTLEPVGLADIRAQACP